MIDWKALLGQGPVETTQLMKDLLAVGHAQAEVEAAATAAMAAGEIEVRLAYVFELARGSDG